MKFSIPSILELIEKSAETIKKYPLVLLMAVIGTVSGIWYAEQSFASQKNYDWLSDLIGVSFLGISFLFAINLYSESREWNRGKALIAGLFGIILLALYYFLPSEYISTGPSELGYRFFLLALTSHLLVSFAPFIHNRSIEQFWEFNKTLFLTILTSALYSAVLFIGLSVALLSIDNLLEFNVDDERYFQLWIFIVGIFNTIFFLSKVPALKDIRSRKMAYPKPLKVFVQYVLIPLVTVYILILYSYLIKIIIQWELPNGWVANLVLSFSIAGIFSLLLLNPIKDELKYSWIRWYSKLYYIALVPLVILLFVSIGTRISEYGVTINRFLVATLAVWLAGIVIYFIVSKSKNIKVIPISLGVIALGISFGPMSASSVSERSQFSEMKEILINNGFLNEQEKAEKNGGAMLFEDQKELSSVVQYLIEHHGIESMQPLFETELEEEDIAKESRIGSLSKSQRIMSLLGLHYINQWEDVENQTGQKMNFYAEGSYMVDIEGYAYFVDNYTFNVFTEVVDNSEEDWIIDYDNIKDEFSIKNTSSGKSVTQGLKGFVGSIEKQAGIFSHLLPHDQLTVEYENEQIKFKLVFINLSFDLSKENQINSFTANIFIAEK